MLFSHNDTLSAHNSSRPMSYISELFGVEGRVVVITGKLILNASVLLLIDYPVQVEAAALATIWPKRS